MCRERGAKRPRRFICEVDIPGPLCGPFAAQGRSYTGQAFYTEKRCTRVFRSTANRDSAWLAADVSSAPAED